MRFTPHAYQTRAIEFVKDNPYSALFLDMGLGKTVSTLTALCELWDCLDVNRVLVIAPKSVALNTWTGECDKWDHLNHLKVSIIMGTAAQRKAAIEAEADVYVINRENTQWLVEQFYNPRTYKFSKPWPYDCVVLDESSSFKNPQSKRFKALLKMRPYITRMVLLTGTPCPNGIMDIWAQMRLLDNGERLGTRLGDFRAKYFHAGAHSGSVVYEYVPNKGAEKVITDKVSDICLSMSAGDYLEMPMLIDGGMTLQFDAIKEYDQFEKDCVMGLEDGAEIEAVTAAALTNKLLQFASGAVYDDDHQWHDVSSVKIDALTELLEQTNEPVLIYYNYKHELARILQAVPNAVKFSGESQILTQWNKGEIKVMLAHPASVAYGLNMQAGGHIIVWFSPTWNLELYQQANARLYRQGQTKPVILYHLVCKDTMDDVVMGALRGKDDIQAKLLEHIKKLQEHYGQ